MDKTPPLIIQALRFKVRPLQVVEWIINIQCDDLNWKNLFRFSVSYSIRPHTRTVSNGQRKKEKKDFICRNEIFQFYFNAEQLIKCGISSNCIIFSDASLFILLLISIEARGIKNGRKKSPLGRFFALQLLLYFKTIFHWGLLLHSTVLIELLFRG